MTPTVIRELRDSTGMTQKEFADFYCIPVSTLRKWEQGSASPPEYVIRLIARSLPVTQHSLKTIAGNGRSFYYDAAANTLLDQAGNMISVKANLTKVKPANLVVYVSDLFDSYYEAVDRFERDCKYDAEVDAVWSSEKQ